MSLPKFLLVIAIIAVIRFGIHIREAAIWVKSKWYRWAVVREAEDETFFAWLEDRYRDEWWWRG